MEPDSRSGLACCTSGLWYENMHFQKLSFWSIAVAQVSRWTEVEGATNLTGATNPKGATNLNSWISSAKEAVSRTDRAEGEEEEEAESVPHSRSHVATPIELGRRRRHDAILLAIHTARDRAAVVRRRGETSIAADLPILRGTGTHVIEDLPRDDLFRRQPEPARDFRDSRDYRDEPARDYRDDRRAYGARSPAPRHRDRSPIPLKRGREPSPIGSRGRRTPPPAKRERLASPVQRNRPDYMDVDQGRDSVATSRRSSPPVHPSRVASMQPAMDERASRPPPRDPYDSRESYRPRSPEPVRRRDSLPRREFADGGYAGVDDRIPPPREPHRADDVPPPRAPPSGPAGYRAPSSTMAPPSGPAAAVSVSAHTRAPAAPPIGPRGSLGAPHMSRGDFGPPRGRGGFRGSFGGAFRGGRGGPPPPFGRGETFNRESFDANAGGPPAGPRGSLSQAGPPPLTFRPSNNSTATTYPRSQRFAPNGQPIPDGPSSTPPTGPRAGRGPPSAPAAATADDHRRVSAPAVHPAMSNLPKVIEGGQSADALVDDTRLRKLQEESERLRRQIEEKEQKKRKSLREWDRMSREVEVASLRSELAEQSLRELNGEAESQAAF
ncbi:hypothetical protein B0A50_06854 [Salinomyces thailandicus]|uniref:Uncharacterized protein n=1 Tax=Salinomyces thailandicus TaxID=706561 RepID=A0A4U0TPX9_9PEZI|nr:hypothetical protein B0A50_06854 [Salinomyces thailandica]